MPLVAYLMYKETLEAKQLTALLVCLLSMSGACHSSVQACHVSFVLVSSEQQ